jgi:hypothetical protein
LQEVAGDDIIAKSEKMKSVWNIAIMLLVTAVAAFGAVSTDFAPYQAIIDRKPFGEALTDPALTKAPVGQAESFLKSLKMCGIKQEEGRVTVAFVNPAKNNKSYYLKVGEKTEDGTDIELVDADFDLESALLKKDSETAWICMSGSPQKAAQIQGSTAKNSASTVRNSPVQARLTYRELQRQREEAKLKQLVEETKKPPKLSGEELEKHLKDYQMEAIRKGLPPLPIPLTQEMDDQLVKEGVLPPQSTPAQAPVQQ